MGNRVALGAFDSTYVLRISVPGYDVLDTSLKPSQLAFDSRWQENASIFSSGQISITTSDVVISHGLGYVPLVLIVPYSIDGSSRRITGNQSVDYAWVTATSLTLKAGLSSATARLYDYLIFTTPAS